MKDLISRNKLYKQIKVYLDTNSLGETSARTELSVGEIASIISDISVVKQQNIESWIPVSERLPEEDGNFLCSFEINDKRWIGIKPYGLTNY